MENAVAENRIADAKRLATICYALYALSCVISVTAIAAIIVNYLKRGDVAGTWVASHFEWQIRTFWYGLAGAVISWLLMFVLIGIPLMIAVGVWVIYRIVKGWLALADDKAVDATKLL